MRTPEDILVAKLAAKAGARRGAASARLALGAGDDAALFRPRGGYETILTCDWFLEGTHFLRDKHSADAVGWKCLARAVSDVAAMGGVPRCFLMSLALPEACAASLRRADRSWLDEFLGGLRRAARRFGCVLAGGDTTRQSRILINVTVVGEVRAGKAVLRSGARPGDVIFVSGRLGEAELGLRLLRGGRGRANEKDHFVRKHLYPEPRLALGRWLAENRIVSAMMDLSDGLSTDLPRLAAASGVGARIAATQIPAVKIPTRMQHRGWDPTQLALDGGDDYELLFTVPRSRATAKLPCAVGGVAITAIGEITKERKLVLIDADGRESALQPRGWDPFRARSGKRQRQSR